MPDGRAEPLGEGDQVDAYGREMAGVRGDRDARVSEQLLDAGVVIGIGQRPVRVILEADAHISLADVLGHLPTARHEPLVVIVLPRDQRREHDSPAPELIGKVDGAADLRHGAPKLLLPSHIDRPRVERREIDACRPQRYAQFHGIRLHHVHMHLPKSDELDVPAARLRHTLERIPKRSVLEADGRYSQSDHRVSSLQRICRRDCPRAKPAWTVPVRHPSHHSGLSFLAKWPRSSFSRSVGVSARSQLSGSGPCSTLQPGHSRKAW